MAQHNTIHGTWHNITHGTTNIPHYLAQHVNCGTLNSEHIAEHGTTYRNTIHFTWHNIHNRQTHLPTDDHECGV